MISKGSIKVGLINGALRTLSNNTGLGRVIASVKPHNVEIETLRIDDLPLMCEDLEVKSDSGKTVTLPHSVQRIREIVRGCQGLIFTSPEYNGAITGPLKNAYDWLSRDYTQFGSPNSKPVGKHTKLGTYILTSGIVGASYISDNSIKDIIRMVEYNQLNVFKDQYYTKLGKSFDKEGNLENNNEEKQRLIEWANNYFKWLTEAEGAKL